MKKHSKYWDNAEVFDSNGTLALQVDKHDLMYCNRVEPSSSPDLHVDGTSEDGTFQGDGKNPPFVVFDAEAQTNTAGPFNTREEAEDALAHELPRRLTDTEHQEWINLIVAAPEAKKLLERALKALKMHQGNSMEDVLGHEPPRGLTMEIYAENVREDIERLIYSIENDNLKDLKEELKR